MTQSWRNWLTARPIAHRGLHDPKKRIVENSIAAAEAAIARKFAIECDIQRAKDGEAIVFHDYEFDRLTQERGPVAARNANQIAALAYRNGPGRIPTLAEFLDRIAGRVPVVIEIKSKFDNDMRLADRAAQILARRNHPLALKSFDPGVMAHLRRKRKELAIADVPLGMVAEADYESDYWSGLPEARRRALAQFLHWSETQPDFLSWRVSDLPHATPHILRQGLGLPVMTWTVRTEKQRSLALQWTDQIVFEETEGLRVH